MANLGDTEFWKGVLSNAVYGLICWIGTKAAKNIQLASSKNPSLWRNLLLCFVFVMWIVTNLFILSKATNYASISIIVTTVLAYFAIHSQVRRFPQIGLIGADTTIATGLSYKDSLRMCHNGLDFLGIGGSKLTELDEFEESIRRCHRESKAVRFLLARPDNQRLQQAAKRKGVDPQAYRERVEKSLRTIAELKSVKSLNVEVRLYSNKEEPIFRLMFVNESLCFVSYNVFGEGDGSQLPQLHVQRFQRERDTGTFYHPFRRYFDVLWQRSKPWDFKFPIA